MLSGHLRETIMRVYDMRPTTAETVMDIAEMASLIAVREYTRGRIDEQDRQGRRWIPCSESLPEQPEQVLVYAMNVHFVLAKYEKYKKAWVVFDAYNVPTEICHDVIAWMPLPEPYKEDETK